jgi:hypothetical protein
MQNRPAGENFGGHAVTIDQGAMLGLCAGTNILQRSGRSVAAAPMRT